MTIGLHIPSTWSHHRDRRGLWIALLEMDLQACLAAGLPPSLPSSQLSSALAETNAAAIYIKSGLSASISIRHRIVTALNTQPDFSFDECINLSRELKHSMTASPSTSEDAKGVSAFHHHFQGHMLEIWMSALHRPFATLGGPQFHYSWSIASSLALKDVKSVAPAYVQGVHRNAFDCLLAGAGIAFRAHAFQCVLFLCLQLYEGLKKNDADIELVGSGGNLRHEMQLALERMLPRVGLHVQRREMAARAYVIMSMTLAHADALKQYAPGTSEYDRHMSKRAAEASETVSGIEAGLRRGSHSLT